MKMVSYEAFACRCGAGDVVLRESYKHKTRAKLYYACPLSKPRENYFGCDFFMKRETSPSTGRFSWSFNDSNLFSRIFTDSNLFSQIFNPPRYSPRGSTHQLCSSGPSRNEECSNCKHLLGKKKVLEATMEMYMHLEQHTLNSTALLHEVYNDMGKLGLE
uniref:Zinc finger GRF-type domain-containing protein n=1 Tax=Tanacetum cinerariifolium TaxID=118510 RepID=A0A6L2JVW9_TANCI|nr:hypothetical protein [Tanacetum cinerariifolium]